MPESKLVCSGLAVGSRLEAVVKSRCLFVLVRKICAKEHGR